jgi:hypothetical protein
MPTTREFDSEFEVTTIHSWASCLVSGVHDHVMSLRLSPWNQRICLMGMKGLDRTSLQ